MSLSEIKREYTEIFLMMEERFTEIRATKEQRCAGQEVTGAMTMDDAVETVQGMVFYYIALGQILLRRSEVLKSFKFYNTMTCIRREPDAYIATDSKS